MTESRKQTRWRQAAQWSRNAVVMSGLAGLVALSYHSASSSSPGAAAGQTDHVNHSVSALANVQNPVPPGGQSNPQAPGLPTAAANGRARPGPADPADPANRQQTSLEVAAGREHPVGPTPAPQGPPPQLRKPVLPSEVFDPGVSIGGCLIEYGANGQCLPVVPPSLARHVEEMKQAGRAPDSMEHRWSCREVRKYFRDGLVVRQKGTDPQGLDTNADGKACSAGDR